MDRILYDPLGGWNWLLSVQVCPGNSTGCPPFYHPIRNRHWERIFQPICKWFSVLEAENIQVFICNMLNTTYFHILIKILIIWGGPFSGLYQNIPSNKRVCVIFRHNFWHLLKSTSFVYIIQKTIFKSVNLHLFSKLLNQVYGLKATKTCYQITKHNNLVESV